MQSQSCQFSFHIDFSKISPTDYALKGIKRMLVQHRSREHFHRGLSRAESAWIAPQRKSQRSKERRKEIGILLLLQTTHTDAQCPQSHSTVSPQDQKHKPVTCVRPGMNSPHEEIRIAWRGECSTWPQPLKAALPGAASQAKLN